jgi:hypothetical protein
VLQENSPAAGPAQACEKEATHCGKYTYIEYARFADDLVILIDAYP